MSSQVRISLCGFGGQGIILSAVVLGTAAVTRAGQYAVQTQSYGSEARGGQCQAELIIDAQPILSPISAKKDILVCMFQEAYGKYIDTLEDDGVLVVDTDLVRTLTRDIPKTFRVPATEIAIALGNKMAANMVMLGFLNECVGLMEMQALKDTVAENVPSRFIELNLNAVDAGVAYARDNGLYAKEG